MYNVVITGASRGLGKAIKERLEHEYIPGFGGHSEPKYIITDFSRTSRVDLTKEIPEFACDILILNAGIWKNDWRLNYEVPKEMAETMPKEKLVIFILSNAAYQSYGNDNYTTSKGGLLQYARRKQREGYNFATISPGTILETEFWNDAEIDNRKKGGIPVSTVAEAVFNIIQTNERGGLITEMIILPNGTHHG